MNQYPTIVSFYTPTWDYPKHASRLIAECERLGLPYHIKQLDPGQSWLDNTRLKSKFIFDSMKELDRPILWIDVDGSIYRRPDILLNVEEDFMGRHQRTGPRRNWHVGTMFFNNTPNGKQLLDEWNTLCQTASGTDEAAFEEVWKKFGTNITFKELPSEYFEIIHDAAQATPNAVIVHRLSKCPSKLEMKRKQNEKANRANSG